MEATPFWRFSNSGFGRLANHAGLVSRDDLGPFFRVAVSRAHQSVGVATELARDYIFIDHDC